MIDRCHDNLCAHATIRSNGQRSHVLHSAYWQYGHKELQYGDERLAQHPRFPPTKSQQLSNCELTSSPTWNLLSPCAPPTAEQ